jgi:hypothetical protein
MTRQKEVTLTQHWAAANLKDYELEVTCRGGRADIVSHCRMLVIEAKFSVNWRTAIGQVQGYLALNFKGYRPAVLLYGDRCSKIDEIFSCLGIQLFWSESYNANIPSMTDKTKRLNKNAEAVRGDSLTVTINEIPYVADEYNQTGSLGFRNSEKRVMHGWLDNKRVATKVDTFWYHRPALTGLKFKTNDDGTVTVVRDYSNLNETTAGDIATKLGITLDAAKGIIDQLMDKDEASDNCLVPVQYVKLRAALDRISTNGKLTEDDHKMFGSKQPGVVLSSYGLSLDRVSNRFRGVSLTAYAEALFFAKDNSRLLDAYLNPTTANDTFEYIEPKEHLDDKISYMKSVWTVAKTAEIRDI